MVMSKKKSLKEPVFFSECKHLDPFPGGSSPRYVSFTELPNESTMAVFGQGINAQPLFVSVDAMKALRALLNDWYDFRTGRDGSANGVV